MGHCVVISGTVFHEQDAADRGVLQEPVEEQNRFGLAEPRSR